MPDKAWKNRERLVSKFFGGVRNALSGINSKVTHSDVIHESLFIECKLRAKHSAVKLWDDTKVLADKENKTPVITLCEKNRPGFWIMVHSDDFSKVSKELDNKKADEEKDWSLEEIVNLAAIEGSVDFSMFGMFLKSDWVVKLVIILLVIFSIQSWKLIIQKILMINKQRKISKQFENHFWSGVSLDELHQQIDDFDQESFSKIFRNIMNEYEKSRLQKKSIDSSFIQRLYTSLDLSIATEDSKLNQGLSFLASSGSVAPFIGLFGTVWGIMNSFQSIAISRNTSLAIVAPGIAEALFATALGLLAAIPAVIAYNKFNNDSILYSKKLENFSKRFLTII